MNYCDRIQSVCDFALVLTKRFSSLKLFQQECFYLWLYHRQMLQTSTIHKIMRTSNPPRA